MENLTLIIPAKMEKESLPIVLNEIKKFNYKAKIILDKNDTETIKAIENFNHKIILFVIFNFLFKSTPVTPPFKK